MSDDSSMRGKVCVVTGATSGIGLETARALAHFGATVVILGRNDQRCETTARAIREQSGNSAIESLVADLSVQAEVRRVAREYQGRFPRLDVLVNNAGAMYMTRRESADGIELTWALNHLGYFLLTNLLLDALMRSPSARVVNVASNAHRVVPRINFDDIQGRKKYKPFPVYGMSKLANILFTRELARRLEGKGVTANALHPGMVATNFGSDLPLAGRLFMRHLGLRPVVGARTAIHLATAPEVEGISGKYFAKQKEVTPSLGARDDAAARELWDVSAAMTGLIAAR
jgi:NAD(P)-dependent dehydrogenase (short-subunit alcohol dehydrogenase family)